MSETNNTLCEHGPCSNSHPPVIPTIGFANEQVELRWCLACGQIELVNKETNEITVLKPGVNFEDSLQEDSNESTSDISK